MRRKPSAAATDEAHAIRVAWWAAFLTTIALIAILGLARSAQALTVPGPSGVAIAAVHTPPPDEATEEDEDEASEEGEFEVEECEEDEGCDEAGAGPEVPRECLLSNVDATVSASHDKVRLLVRYTTTAPTAVTVDYGLHGSKGALYLGGEKKNFARRGALHLAKNLTESQMAKVMAATDFTVRLRLAAAPHYCQPFFERQLTIRQATPGGLVWKQPE